MLKFISTTGGAAPVDFETAILNGFASDGGLYVPEYLPKITTAQLQSWQQLSYPELAFEILSLFMDKSVISAVDLKQLLHQSFATFGHADILPLYPLKSKQDIYIMELFHGPTLSFKDVAMGFLVNLFDYFLKRKGKHMHIILATTGDTGPAAAFASAGKATIDTWTLYPAGMITPEQERQMTTISSQNVHAVRIEDCPDGGDDIDVLIAELFADEAFKEKLNLSSVNSINWGRVMMQTVHYFYAYLHVVDAVGEPVNFAVPSGAFGNLCAGTLAREMGLPVEKFICANNKNACLHRIFTQGLMSKAPMISCTSSAIDILIPYNFWRYLYFSTGQDGTKIKQFIHDFQTTGKLQFDQETHAILTKGILSDSIADAQTLDTIKQLYAQEKYLIDPHGAVALAAVQNMKTQLSGTKLVSMATAHPAKFPDIIKRVFETENRLPEAAFHAAIEAEKLKEERVLSCNHSNMREVVREAMEQVHIKYLS